MGATETLPCEGLEVCAKREFHSRYPPLGAVGQEDPGGDLPNEHLKNGRFPPGRGGQT